MSYCVVDYVQREEPENEEEEEEEDLEIDMDDEEEEEEEMVSRGTTTTPAIPGTTTTPTTPMMEGGNGDSSSEVDMGRMSDLGEESLNSSMDDEGDSPPGLNDNNGLDVLDPEACEAWQR